MVSKEEYMHFVKEMLKEEIIKDEERLKKREENKNFTIGFAIFLFFIIVVTAFVINIIAGFIGFFVWLLIVVFTKPGIKSHAYYRKEYRDRALDFLLKDVNHTFNEEATIESSVVAKSQLIGNFDDLECSDKLSINIENDDGSKSNCFLTLCDLKATRTEERDVDRFDDDTPMYRREKEEVIIDVYKGMFGYVEFPFEFKCLMCINSNYKKKNVILRDVKLEDSVFGKKFRVWCDDQIEARYILTPDMMEKLIYLKKRLGSLHITLVDNMMYIRSYGKNLFELSGSKEKPETLFEKIYDDVETILFLVKEIKNNNKIFRM